MSMYFCTMSRSVTGGWAGWAIAHPVFGRIEGQVTLTSWSGKKTGGKKYSTGQRCIFLRWRFYKIHILVVLVLVGLNPKSCEIIFRWFLSLQIYYKCDIRIRLLYNWRFRIKFEQNWSFRILLGIYRIVLMISITFWCHPSSNISLHNPITHLAWIGVFYSGNSLNTGNPLAC